MKVDVINIEGKKTGSIELNDAIFNIEPNDHAIYLDVKQYLANQRQGTHKAKDRGEVSGSTRKLKRQKGTGTARAGSIKAGVFVGGGRIFGPQPRDYGFKVNKKVKALARKSALTHKVKSNSLVVIEDFAMDKPNTKSFFDILNKLNIVEEKSLFVFGETNKNVYLSSRNIKNSNVVTAHDINTYSILNTKKLLLTVASVKSIESNLL